MGAPGTNSRNGKALDATLADDSGQVAEDAGLQYVSDDRPGYTRRANDGEFKYLDTQGKQIRDEQRLLRIKRLAIPPAWTDVWICPSANGHIQATGRDARRRKQYRYHERWREIRDENKFGRLADFAKALPNIRRRVAKDLKLPGLPRPKVLATVVRLLEQTFIRVGNEEYARENKSFGLTTMKNRHVTVKGARLRFRFRGKSGRHHEVDVTDRRIAKIVSKCQDLAGQDLFQYVSDDGAVGDVTSQDVNDYLREITNENFTAKDFRTWAGTVLAAIALNAQGKIKFQIAYQSDLKFVAETMQQIVEKELGEEMMKRVELFRDLLARTPVDELEVRSRPRVIFRVDEITWIDAIVRYLVSPHEAGSVKTRLIPKLLAALNAEPDKVMFPAGANR